MTFRELNPFSKKSVPIRRDTEHPLNLLRRDIDTLFDDFFGGFDMEPFLGRNSASFTPKVDVTESDKEIRVSAELPGVDEKDIDLTLNHDSLTIRGEKKEEKEDKGQNYYSVERSYGSFCRTIPLHVEVDTDRAKASYKKGILIISIPKSPRAIDEKKKITVKVE